jgi:hypothetical protein
MNAASKILGCFGLLAAFPCLCAAKPATNGREAQAQDGSSGVGGTGVFYDFHLEEGPVQISK